MNVVPKAKVDELKKGDTILSDFNVLDKNTLFSHVGYLDSIKQLAGYSLLTTKFESHNYDLHQLWYEHDTNLKANVKIDNISFIKTPLEREKEEMSKIALNFSLLGEVRYVRGKENDDVYRERLKVPLNDGVIKIVHDLNDLRMEAEPQEFSVNSSLLYDFIEKTEKCFSRLHRPTDSIICKMEIEFPGVGSLLLKGGDKTHPQAPETPLTTHLKLPKP